jgi:ABC-type siderophore export system fused ATPase/permease subunit
MKKLIKSNREDIAKYFPSKILKKLDGLRWTKILTVAFSHSYLYCFLKVDFLNVNFFVFTYSIFLNYLVVPLKSQISNYNHYLAAQITFRIKPHIFVKSFDTFKNSIKIFSDLSVSNPTE